METAAAPPLPQPSRFPIMIWMKETMVSSTCSSLCMGLNFGSGAQILERNQAIVHKNQQKEQSKRQGGNLLRLTVVFSGDGVFHEGEVWEYKGAYKHLEKSKSSSASASPINRRDDSLLLQHDGIQSAILHCKRSFNSSRESSWLSRCTSDSSSQDKLSNASSTDSSLFSRVTSNSARTSGEEGHAFST
ncbi:hypothetical protein F3Y22_tig00110156pilonHSYRG00617 [Hibiscus syriacus]|uniref:Uncharacterized protein n=1 Tax=Hibiscus syriacus TaxID=106335 RepID=A0A6A3BHR2_HIBSY|nr:hypothetical protein F3Y22_tig00110156pilonHSYRG00617 [Hibiscus syriacus]